MSIPMESLQHIHAATEYFKTSFDNIEIILPSLRSLRTWFAESTEMQIGQDECSTSLSILTEVVTVLLSPNHRSHLDLTEGAHHLVLSVAFQCLVNCLSYMSPRGMHISGEVAAALLTLFLYDLRIQSWVFSLDTVGRLSLWRLRLASYSFILTTNLVTAVQRSGIPADFARVVLIAARCAQRVVSSSEEEKAKEEEKEQASKLLLDWFDHCLSLISTMCSQKQATGSRKSGVYVLQIAQALGHLLLLTSFEDRLGRLEAPQVMRKLAMSCLHACLPTAMEVSKNAALLTSWMKECRNILHKCTRDSSPFAIANTENSICEIENLTQADMSLSLAAFRGAVFILLNILSDDWQNKDVAAAVSNPSNITSSASSLTIPNPVAVADANMLLIPLLFTLGDCLVIIDGLLHTSLANAEPIGERKKAPSLMDNMGEFSFENPATICFAAELKQDIVRALLSLVNCKQSLVVQFTLHPTVTCLQCRGSTSRLLATDVFWAVLNATQRDPASPLAVEWAIVLLRLLLNPSGEEVSSEVTTAASVLVERIAKLEPSASAASASLRDQLKLIPNLKFS